MTVQPDDYMRGYFVAHEVLVPQMDAGVPSSVIEEIHREAEAEFDPDTASQGEADFHNGYADHAQDLFSTYRTVEQAEADPEPEAEMG